MSHKECAQHRNTFFWVLHGHIYFVLVSCELVLSWSTRSDTQYVNKKLAKTKTGRIKRWRVSRLTKAKELQEKYHAVQSLTNGTINIPLTKQLVNRMNLKLRSTHTTLKFALQKCFYLVTYSICACSLNHSSTFAPSKISWTFTNKNISAHHGQARKNIPMGKYLDR